MERKSRNEGAEALVFSHGVTQWIVVDFRFVIGVLSGMKEDVPLLVVMTAINPVTENVVHHVEGKLPLSNDSQPLSNNVEISDRFSISY